MAESVQAAMDRMVTPLRDFMERGIFTESEIRSIVSRRRRSEYLLYRRTARLNDYLTYINDEVNLEKLRILRHKRLLARRKRELQEQRKNKQNSNPGSIDQTSSKFTQFSEYDTHIVRHIHLLYARLIHRFGNDNVSVYYQHAQFAKDFKSYTILGRVYAEALRKHPRVIGLWIEAASHEFFGCPGEDDEEDENDDNEKNTQKGSADGGRVGKGGTGGSVSNARVLMQRGLRVNPNSKELWKQYFALEMHYVQKIRGRRKILQLGGEEEEADGSGNKKNANDDHAMALVIYQNAIKTISDDINFRLSFIELCQSFPQTDEIEDKIMLSIDKDFDGSEDAWIARITYAAEKSKKNIEHNDENGFLTEWKVEKDETRFGIDTSDSLLDLLNKATDKVPTAKMYLFTFQFARSRMREMLDEVAADGKNSTNNEDVATALSPEAAMSITKQALFLDKTLKKALSPSTENVVNSSPDLILELADYLLHSGQPRDSVDILKRAVGVNNKNKAVRTDGRIWIRWSDIVGRIEESSSPGCYDHKAARDILQMGLQFIDVNESGHCMVLIELIRLLLDDCGQRETSSGMIQKEGEYLFSLVQRLLLLCARDSSSPSLYGVREEVVGAVVPDLCLRHLHLSSTLGGIKKARRSYESVLFQSGYVRSCEGMDDDEVDGIRSFFEGCLEVEKSNATNVTMNVTQKEDTSKMIGRRSAKKIKAKPMTATTTAVTKKEMRHRLRRIYDAAIGFFQEGGNDASAMEYKKRRDEQLIFA
mmetsp:Transcript_24525/g.35994  ORF Transcript_24525/g.35994 Transcript_24525/m.35994 type:complete len:763 (-) Transcript_24525:421-2709(-)